MKDPLPFDHRPDPLLGRALRRALDPGDGAAFVARVLRRAAQVRAGSWDAVLAHWARLGVAAAMVIALAAGYLLGRSAATFAPRRPSVPDALLLPAMPAPDAEVVLASVIDN